LLFSGEFLHSGCSFLRISTKPSYDKTIVAQIRHEFLTGSEGIGFTGESRAAIDGWTEQLLVAQEFSGKSRKQRGAIRRYASKVTGLCLPQVTRLIRSYVQTGTWNCG
jgi:hypothetical protein